MFRRFLCLSAGALALLVALGVPGQVHAQCMRGAVPNRMTPAFRGGFLPGFRGGAMPGFRGGFDPRFNTPRAAEQGSA